MSPTQFLLPYFCYEHSGNGCQQNSCMLPGRPITLRMLNREDLAVDVDQCAERTCWIHRSAMLFCFSPIVA